MNYKDLKLNNSSSINYTFTYNNSVISVKHYLSISEKMELLDKTITAASTEYSYNPLLLDVYFHMNLFMYYTDVEFTEDDLADINTLYDSLCQSGIMKQFLNTMDKQEYEDLYDWLNDFIKVKSAVLPAVFSFVNTLPDKLQELADKVNEFDPEKYQAVIDFATAANGGRPLA